MHSLPKGNRNSLILLRPAETPARVLVCYSSHSTGGAAPRPIWDGGLLSGERPALTCIVFNEIVASRKLAFIFNNIVALMCRLLPLNDLAQTLRP